MKEFNIILGLNDKDSHIQEISTIDAYKIVQNLISNCSISEQMGVYTHNDGTKILEKSLVIKMIDFEGTLESQIPNLIQNLKRIMNQESVVLITNEINSQLL